MDELRSAIEDLLTKTTERGPWHPALEPALFGLEAEQAAWRPAGERNSIHMIVRHLILWKRALLADIGGDTPDLREVSAADWKPLETDPAAWERDVAELTRLHRETREAAADAASGRILPAFKTQLDRTLLYLAAHDAYHTGQIMLLRKLQGL